MSRKFLSALVAMAMVVLLGSPAWSAQQTATMNVSIQVTSVAATVNTSALNFGTVFQGSTGKATATITVTVTNGANYKIAIGGGNNSASPHAATCNRRMIDAGAVIGGAVSYNLTKNAYGSASGIIWGDACLATPTFSCGATAGNGGNGDCVSATGTGIAQTYTVYGETTTIPASAASGIYTDTVLITVLY